MRILTLALCLLFLGCTKADRTQIRFLKKREIKLVHDGLQSSSPFAAHFVKMEQDEKIVCLDRTKKELLIFRSDGQLEKKIDVNLFQPCDLWGCNYRAADSIYLVFNPHYFPGNRHDSTIIRINDQGEILEAIDLGRLPALEHRTGQEKDPSNMFYFLSKIRLNNNRLVFPLSKSATSGPNMPAFYDSPTPTTGLVNLNTDEAREIQIPYPKTEGLVYPDWWYLPVSTLTADGKYISGYGFTSQINVYDLNRDSIYTRKVKSVFIDTIPPVHQEAYEQIEVSLQEANIPMYSLIQANPYGTQVIRSYDIPVDPSKNNPKRITGLILLNENLQVIAEGILPPGLSFFSGFWSGKEFCFFNPEKSDSSGNGWYFECYELHPEKNPTRSLPHIRDSLVRALDINLKPGGIEAYLREYFPIPEEDAAIILLFTDGGCPGCKDASASYFLQQDPDRPVYLFLAGPTENEVAIFLQKNGIPPNSPKLFTDPKGHYFQYIEDYTHPSYLLLQKDGEIQRQVLLDPQGTRALNTLVDNFLKNSAPE